MTKILLVQGANLTFLGRRDAISAQTACRYKQNHFIPVTCEKIPQTAAAPRRYSASYFEYCDARGRPGSRACRGRHWRACSRMRGAACGMRLDPQIGRAGHPFDDTGEVSVSGRRKERGRSRLLTPPRRAILLRPLRPHRPPIRVCLAASVISQLPGRRTMKRPWRTLAIDGSDAIVRSNSL